MKEPWRVFAFAVLTIAVAGCNSSPPTPHKAAEYDYRLKHPVVVEERISALRLTAERNGGLAMEDRGRLAKFSGEFLRRGHGVLDISVGAESAQDAAARGFGQAIAATLLEGGLKMNEVHLQLVLDEPAIPQGSAFLRFNTSKADLPECYDWSSGERNAPLANFGCAIQHNIGAMVADPRDLSEARPGGAMSGARGAAAIDKMNQGAATWSTPLPWGASSTMSPSGGGR